MKKPSAASSKSPREPPSIPTFSIDRCLGDRTLADALHARGLPVRIHKDHFAPDARDVDWLREVGQHKWIVLTKDKMLRHREIEFRALREAGVRAFILTSGNLKAIDMAEAFVKALPRMQRLLKDTSGGFIARVSRTGAVELLQ